MTTGRKQGLCRVCPTTLLINFECKRRWIALNEIGTHPSPRTPCDFRKKRMNRKPVSPNQDKTARQSSARNLLRRLLGGDVERTQTTRGRLLLEPLESRQMLAGDVEWLSTTTDVQTTANSQQDWSQFSTAGLVAEGEAAPDLVAFAKALDQAGVTFFGAAWCPFCTEQKELFGDGKEELPFVEVTNPDRTLNSIGQAENIQTFPTWEFPDSSRATGVLSLAEISERSGVPIPSSDQPTFAPIGNLTVEVGSPLHVPVDAYDPGGGPVTVTVSVADPSLLQATVLQNNRSARITVEGWGEMVFELFEDKAPRPTGRFIELAQAGFYDQSANSEIIFHRVIDNFVLQAGDPTGTGSGGSTLGDFDDQFHVDLQHNRTGVLSYAKSLDDTNDSQFFITEGAQRHLDFNHSIFGQIVEGDAVREAISETAVTNSRPNTPIKIESVEIFTDNENSIVMLKPTGSGTGQTDVTFTVTDANGNQFSEVVTVTVVADAVNGAPFLRDINAVSTPSGVPAVIQLESVDAEGDPVTYEARVIDSSGATTSVDQATGRVTVTPAAGYSGQVRVEVGVRSQSTPTSTNSSTRSQTMDLQVVTVNVGPTAPTGVSLNASSDTGISNSDGITNTAPVTFTVTGVTAGATVEVLSGDTQIGVGLATGSTATITTNNFAALGNATHTVTARQTVNGIASAKSPAITVTYDTVAPVDAGAIPLQASLNTAYVGDLQHPEESNGLRYALVSGPTGMTVNATTGLINWTPTTGQTGNQSVVIRLTDAAGNAKEQTYTINVGAEPLVTVRLEMTDLNNNVITSVAPGDEFKVRVFADDERLFGEAQGVFALYLDMLFDAELAEPSPFTPQPTEAEPNPTPTIFEYSTIYTSGRSGTAGNGVIDEAGAFSSQSSFLGPGERFVFSVRMKALATGTLTVTTDPAEDPGKEVALFDRDDEVPTNRVVYGSASLAIAASFNAVNDSASVNEDSTNNSISPLANDTIVTTGTTLTLVSVQTTSAQGGTVSVNGNNAIYTPQANFFGTDTFTYVVRDQNGVQQTATVTVSVQPQNDPPNAVNDTIQVASGSTENLINVLANDSIAPDTGETLRVTATSASAAGGTLRIGTGGANVLYTPRAGFTGTDTFTYTVSDGTATDTATVTVTVGPANDPPTAVNDTFTINEDAAAAEFNVIANDSNSDPNETFALFSVASPANGTASVTSNGRLRYQPNANFNGVDRVVYTIRDSNGGTASATATFNVTAINDAPPAPTLDKNVTKGSTATQVLNVSELAAVNVDANETLTITATGTTSAGGTVTIAANGQSLSYTPPNANFTGSDTFTYTVRDAGGLTTTGTMTVQTLDYIPRDIMLDLDLPSTANFGSGIQFLLSGTTFNGSPVTDTLTLQNNMLTASELAPGSYRLTLPAIPFLAGGQQARTIDVQLSESDTNGQTVTESYGGVLPTYLSVRDFLGSTPRVAAFAVVRPGAAHSWIMTSNSASLPGNPTLSLSSDGQTLTLEVDGTQTNSPRRRATIPVTDPRVENRGTENGHHLFRVNIDPTGLTFTNVTNTPATNGTTNGEGEGASQSTLSSPGTFNTPSTLSSQSQQQPLSNNPLANAGTNSTNNANSSSSSQQSLRSGSMTAEGEGGPIESVSALTNELETAAVDTPVEQLSDEAGSTNAVDTAMLDLLPTLQRRSPLGEALAEAPQETNLEAVDATFETLDGNLPS